MLFDDYKDAHRGTVAWLFGAGPSLDAFLAARPFIPAEDLVVAVNEVPIVLEAHGIHCSYGFAADPTDRFAASLPATLPLFLGATAARESKCGNRGSALDILVPGAPERGTIILAAHVLREMGISQLICVGIDGGSARAAQPWISPPSLCVRSYSIIRELFLEWTQRHKMAVTFWAPAGAPALAACPTRTSSRRLGPALGAVLGRHRGATALLFGKGPSLDLFLDRKRPPPEIKLPIGRRPVLAFLNDTVRYRHEIIEAVGRWVGIDPSIEYPFDLYAFANDGIARWHEHYGPDVTLFQPVRTLLDPSMAAPVPACPRIAFEDSGGDHARLQLPQAHLVERGLVSMHGTCDSAAQILHVMGCAHLIAIGCDGTPGRAAREWSTEIRDDHATDYPDIRRDFEKVIRGLGITTAFYGEDTVIRRDPTAAKVLHITRATVFRGHAIDAGSTIPDATPHEIHEMLACGKAELVHA